MDRAKILACVRERSEPWDIIVIGGGATGVGCAVDAASRGFDVLLLEQHDFGKGTSSRSTKLIHGGVRYLRQGDLSLVREGLRERKILLRNAPHVVHTQAFVVPCYGLVQKLWYWAGLRLYDLLAGKDSLGRSRMLSRAETIERLPTIRKEGLSGGILYYDGQFDDTRLLIDLVTAAHKHGAAVLNYAQVRSFTKTVSGKIDGVSFADQDSGEVLTARARVVINATGAFCDNVRSLSDSGSKPIVAPSQGVHLVFDRKFLPSTDALLIPRTGDGRILFCIPWLGSTLIGTTDTSVAGTDLEPAAQADEIDFILETAGRYLDPRPTRGDIQSVFAGIRPLVRSDAASGSTASLSRGHTVEINQAGLVTITGGKWTTYRSMAEDAVNQAARLAGLPVIQCVTANLPISGRPMREPHNAPSPSTEILLISHDWVHAVRSEMALTVEDVLARRERLLFLNASYAITIAPMVAAVMAREMGKDEEWVADQIRQFNEVAENYLGE